MGYGYHNHSLEYEAYLKSKEWREKREQRLEIDNYECQACHTKGSKQNPLEIHHLNYMSLMHEVPERDLVCLCRRCHRRLHKVMG
ncbi:MAG: HNH endonuclease [Clostridiales bacterium]|nr:HNH endonuclease [Clostridiales bacterium]